MNVQEARRIVAGCENEESPVRPECFVYASPILSRGIAVELPLTHLLAARQVGAAPQLIALSAVIGHINHFDEWLVSRTLVTGVWPVPLTEGVLDRSGQFQFVDVNGNEQLTQLLPYHAIQVRRENPSARDVIVPLVKQLVRGTTEKVLVFRNQRGSAEGCAAYLASDVGLPPAMDALAMLPSRDLSSTSADLRRCLNGGTAFHNTNLTREEKQIVERAYGLPRASHLGQNERGNEAHRIVASLRS